MDGCKGYLPASHLDMCITDSKEAGVVRVQSLPPHVQLRASAQPKEGRCRLQPCSVSKCLVESSLHFGRDTGTALLYEAGWANASLCGRRKKSGDLAERHCSGHSFISASTARWLISIWRLAQLASINLQAAGWREDQVHLEVGFD